MATSAEWDALQVAVTAKDAIDDSVVAFINGLAPILTAAAGDRAATLQVVADLKTRGDALTAAVLANSPATPPGPVVPDGQPAPVAP